MLAHWDDVDQRRVERGHVRGVWQDLGRASGTRWTGVKRIRIELGYWSTPADIHGREGEIFFVLGSRARRQPRMQVGAA